MKTATGATPLFAVEAVSLDCETTGLDPSTARIVQLGCVHLRSNAVEAHSCWERIVDPGVAIARSSTEIHGIADEQARQAPPLTTLWPQLLAKLEHRVMIGHTIGFDLAVLEAEAARYRLAWRKPRALCVRMLATLVAPDLADHSLDALANWLGLEMGQRHRALGDALTAAHIFTALIPKLAGIGVNTLAEAERASLRLGFEVERHRNAGWRMPVESPGIDGLPKAAGFDSAAYRRSVAEIMSAPVAVGGNATLKQAIDLMTARRISSVFVAEPSTPGQDTGSYGILTERDALRRISADGERAFAMKASAIASRPVRAIGQSALLYRAIGRMARLGYRHLGVRDEENRLVGVLSARDLLRARTSPAIVLGDSIAAARTAAELSQAWATLPAVTATLLADEIEPESVCRVISEEIRAMTGRAAALAEEAMGEPPCGYAVLVLGSGGRGESMLAPDQDNAIVFETGGPGGENDRWFAELGKRMSDLLNQAGIPYCKGGVMARNDAWRGSTRTWRERVDGWLRKSLPEDLLNVDIFFDAFPVHGQVALGHELFVHAYTRGHDNLSFAKLLGETLATVPDPFTLFGGIRGDSQGGLDLKSHLLFPVAALARTLAIRHNVARRGSRERIDGLIALGIGGETDLLALAEAQRLGFALILGNQSRAIESGLKPTNRIDPAGLDRAKLRQLKSALRQIRIAPQLVRDLMFAAAATGGQ
jgi:CBS domain-containing protein